VTPTEMFERHSPDAVRYWAASARLGIDAIFDEQQMKIGRKLAIKVLNASRFALGSIEGAAGEIVDDLDRSMLAGLGGLVDEATRAFEDYDHAKALDVTERFFWNLTDDYLELVKSRAYGTHGAEAAGSAIASLRLALSVLLRLFAPFLPYVTEEVWSWWNDGSIHLASWPTTGEIPAGGDAAPFETASWMLKEFRGAKSQAKRSLKAEVERAVVRDTPDRLAALARVERDVREAGNVATLETSPLADGETPSVEVVFAESPPAG
jgi:valyl-tRNA synthetase